VKDKESDGLTRRSRAGEAVRASARSGPKPDAIPSSSSWRPKGGPSRGARGRVSAQKRYAANRRGEPLRHCRCRKTTSQAARSRDRIPCLPRASYGCGETFGERRRASDRRDGGGAAQALTSFPADDGRGSSRPSSFRSRNSRRAATKNAVRAVRFLALACFAPAEAVPPTVCRVSAGMRRAGLGRGAEEEIFSLDQETLRIDAQTVRRKELKPGQDK